MCVYMYIYSSIKEHMCGDDGKLFITGEFNNTPKTKLIRREHNNKVLSVS